MIFSFTFIKNSTPPSCVLFQTLQLLSETFFSKLNSVLNIRLARLKQNTLYTMRTYKPETLLRQHISNIERLYKNNVVRQHCNDIETILLGNLQCSNMVAMFWQYSMLCRNMI